MKVLQFTVPVVQSDSVVVQEDILPYFYNYFHRHKEAQITLILKGEGTLIAGNYTQPFKAGELYILGANQPHIFKAHPKYFESIKANSIHAIHIYVNQEKLLASIMNLPEFERTNKFLRDTSQGLQLHEKYIEQAARLVKKIKQAAGLERLLELLQLLHFLSKDVKEWKSLSNGFSKFSMGEMDGLRINDIYQYTIDHYAENISLKKVSEVAHITPHAFCKYFKKHTRKTYMGFLNEIRIYEACKKIINGSTDSISSVAYQTGFNNAITFNRVFKKIMGMTPTDYMERYKNK